MSVKKQILFLYVNLYRGLCYVLDSSLQVLEADSMGYKSVVVIRDALSGKRQEPRPNFDNHMRWGKFFFKV